MADKVKAHRQVVRVAGKLREIVTVLDERGKPLHRFIRPLKLEFYLRDVIQIMVGAVILAVPIGFTEEVWRLGESLPLLNVALISLLSVAFISIFTYYNYYRSTMRHNWDEFLKRVAGTYIVSFIVVGVILQLIDVASFEAELLISVKRAVLVALPASMSGAVVDMIK